jgi:hypothetical protein
MRLCHLRCCGKNSSSIYCLFDNFNGIAGYPRLVVWQFGVGLLLSRHRSSRHFPAPWRAVKTHNGYVVRDANDQALAYIYSHENEVDARRFNELTSDEAIRIALVLAALPELLVGDAKVADEGDLVFRPQGEITLGDQVSSQSCIRCGTPMTLIQTESDDPVYIASSLNVPPVATKYVCGCASPNAGKPVEPSGEQLCV